MKTDIDFTKPIYLRADGAIICQRPFGPWGIAPDTDYALDLAEWIADGGSVLPEPVPPAPTQEELKAMARNARDSALRDIVDRYNAPRWEAMTEAERQAVRDYRQELLDWPESAGFPDIATLPKL